MKLHLGIALCATLLVASALHAESTVTVHVLGLFHPRTLELRSASAQPIIVSDSSPRFLLTGEPPHRSLVVHAKNDRVLADGFLFPSLVVSARDRSAALVELIVPARFRRVYHGTLTLTARHNELFAVVAMTLEDAVTSVVAAEMPANAPSEALKAQAIVARSFLTAGARHNGFDFCDTTHCQFMRSPNEAAASVRSALSTTSGLILTWGHHPLAALYSSRCGGHTNTMHDAGLDPGNGYPYFSVSCAWCVAHAPHWQIQPATGANPPRAGDEAARIRYVRQWGWSALPANHFTSSAEPGSTRLEGRAIGHGIGLCQRGAIAMAEDGTDFRTILMHYYPATTIEFAP